jgi:hypothetical protein
MLASNRLRTEDFVTIRLATTYLTEVAYLFLKYIHKHTTGGMMFYLDIWNVAEAIHVRRVN